MGLSRTNKLSFLWILILCCSFAFSQKREIDSLVKLMGKLPEDTTMVKARNELMGFYMETGDFNEMLELCRENEILINDLSIRDTSVAMKKALNYFLGSTILSKGSAWMRKGDNAKALDCFIRSAELFQAFSNKKHYLRTLNNIGVVLVNLGELKRALTYFEKSLVLSEELGSKEGIIRCFLNIGNIYNDLHEPKKAIVYLNKCLLISEQENIKGGIAGALGNLGMTYDMLGDHEKAQGYFFRCLKVSEDMGDKLSIARCYNKLGESYYAAKKYEECLKYELMCYELAEQIGVLEMKKRAADDLSQVYQTLNKPTEALKYYKIFVASKDSLINLEQAKNILTKEMEFEFNKKESVNKVLQEKKDAIAEKEKHEQKLVRNYLIAGFILVTLLAVVVYRNFRQKAKANDIISKQKTEVESQKALVEVKNKEITDSITYAKRIQLALLANQTLLEQNIKEHFILFEPKDIVSGDFYWASKQKNGFYLAVCDSTGHGVPGAFMSLLNISYLNESISEKNLTRPNEIFDHVRRKLIENISHGGAQDGMDAIMIQIDEKNERLQYAAANNSSVIIRDKAIIPFVSDHMPVGKGEKNEPFVLRSVDLMKDDLIILYTDGYADQFGGSKGKKLKYKRLNEILVSNSHLPMQELGVMMRAEFVKWKGNLEQVDDVCVIGIRI